MADMEESWETQALREHTVKLELALVSDILFVANELNKAYILSDTELEEIKAVPSLLNDSQKAGKILSTVKRLVKINSSNFEKFVAILKKKPQTFRTILNLLSRDGSPSCPGQEQEVKGENWQYLWETMHAPTTNVVPMLKG